MKFTLILFTIIFSCTGLTFGNTDFTYCQRFKNIYAEQGFITNTTSTCGREKFYIFLSLLTELSKKVCNDSVYIHVRFGDDFICNLDGTGYNTAYAIGYYNYDFPLPFEELPAYLKPYKTSRFVLNLICRNGDPDISACLTLIYYALTHKENICRSQGIKRADNWHKENLIPSISIKEIDHIISNKQPVITSLISNRSFNLWPLADVPIGYYYQNDRYYLYKKLPNTKFWGDTTGPVLFDVDNISEIIKVDTFNYLILTNDTTFYHVKLNNEKVEGPFIYPDLAKLRMEGLDIRTLREEKFLFTYHLTGFSARVLFDSYNKKMILLPRALSKPPWSWLYPEKRYWFR